VNVGVTSNYLKREYEKALKCEETGDCRDEGCHICGFENLFSTCQDRLAKTK
jgi:hypothetical protein